MRQFAVVISLILVGCVASLTLNAQQAGVASTAKPTLLKWEYLVAVASASSDGVNHYGENGWELVAVTADPRDQNKMATMNFKRPKQ